jgi:hypothetical protein
MFFTGFNIKPTFPAGEFAYDPSPKTGLGFSAPKKDSIADVVGITKKFPFLKSLWNQYVGIIAWVLLVGPMIAEVVGKKSNKGSGFGSAIDVDICLNLQFPHPRFFIPSLQNPGWKPPARQKY